jgi:hypothetical protein
LKGIRAGDTIALEMRDGDFEYLVESTAVVRPSDIQVLPVFLPRLGARSLHRPNSRSQGTFNRHITGRQQGEET